MNEADKLLDKLNLIDAEWNAWQEVVKEFKKSVGDIDSPRYNLLLQAIKSWGEQLFEIRCNQLYEWVDSQAFKSTDAKLNPVTLRGIRNKENVALTIGRLHPIVNGRLTVPDGMHRLTPEERVEKLVTCVMWEGDQTMDKRLGEIIIDEEHFVRGMKLLFPKE